LIELNRCRYLESSPQSNCSFNKAYSTFINKLSLLLMGQATKREATIGKYVQGTHISFSKVLLENGNWKDYENGDLKVLVAKENTKLAPEQPRVEVEDFNDQNVYR